MANVQNQNNQNQKSQQPGRERDLQNANRGSSEQDKSIRSPDRESDKDMSRGGRSSY